jgi:hypothetical protein
MDEQTLEIAFDSCDPADAGRLATALEEDLREIHGSTKISLKKERPDAQDFGSTLVLVFGTPVAIALAGAISTFLQRNSGARIRISKSGEVIASNLESQDAAKIAAAFTGKRSN